MKILTTRGVGASGKLLDADGVYEVSEADASLLIRMGAAVPAPEKEPEKEVPKATRKRSPKQHKGENDVTV